MEGARFLALLLYFEGRGAIAPLKRDALLELLLLQVLMLDQTVRFHRASLVQYI